MSKALFIVDVQNDFTEGGPLAVEDGDAVAQRISDYVRAHADDYDVIIASRDWHDGDNDNQGHFHPEPDFVDSWPPHCVSGTEGAEYDPGLDTASITHHVKKGQGKPAYSAFEGTTDDGRTVEEILDEHGVLDADVAGIATDYCVRATTLDAISHGRHVRVFTDLVAGVAPASSEAALAELAHAGAELVESDA
jgi:nicotinamidase/pyrazinamidase